MRYEPVGYIIEYEISALLFLIVIAIRYFGARRFPNQKNHLFSIILWVTIVDLVLDVVSSWIIDNVFLVPRPVTYLVNSCFYFLTILLPMSMAAYTAVLAEYVSLKRLRKLFPLLIPGLGMVFMLLTNPVTHWLFYVEPTRGYVHGDRFLLVYLACFFYIIVTFSIAFRNRKSLRRIEYVSICRFLGLVLASTVAQYLYPVLLVSGVAIALSVTLMYFTLQNPDTMLDTTTEAFTYDAMLTFLRDRMQEQSRVQLVAVKIGNMPRINELLGIENGSLLLKQVSQFLRESASESWVFRMRGSCFVAITRRSEDYRTLVERVEDKVAKPWLVGNTEILLQATVCRVATDELLANPISPEEAVNFLENAFLQNERSHNRAKTITIGAELLDTIQRRRAVERALRVAIEKGEGLELYLQPIWSVKKERFISAEVLLRFQHPTMGFIPPDEFVRIAENSGLVTAMDELVVRKTCEFIRANDPARTLGLETIEINLSALEFMHLRFPDLINEILSQYQVEPKFLCFEITETAATESFELLSACMDDLTQTGCQFALDDFGTGYANISQVIQLPFSIVKLDKSLLSGSEVVLGDMARMFARMNRRTVIEGVETSAQVAMTEALQVDYIQGYYYAKPMNQQAFIQFMRAHDARNASPTV